MFPNYEYNRKKYELQRRLHHPTRCFYAQKLIVLRKELRGIRLLRNFFFFCNIKIRSYSGETFIVEVGVSIYILQNSSAKGNTGFCWHTIESNDAQ
jgi:hypothetical protein